MSSLASDLDSFVILGTSPMSSYIDNSENLFSSIKDKNEQPSLADQIPHDVSESKVSMSKKTPESSLKNNQNAISMGRTSIQSGPIDVWAKSTTSIPSNSTSMNGTTEEQNTNNVENISIDSANRSLKSILSTNDIAQNVIMGNLSSKDLEGFSLMNSGTDMDSSKVIENQAMFLKRIETILKNNNIKLRQQYAKIQNYQSEVANTAAFTSAEIKKRDDRILMLETKVKETEQWVDKMSKENEILQTKNKEIEESQRVNLTVYENENFELKKMISEKKSVIQNMAAELEKYNNMPGKSMEVIINPKENTISLEEHRLLMREMKGKLDEAVAKNYELEDIRRGMEQGRNAQVADLERLEHELKLKDDFINQLKIDKQEIEEKFAVVQFQADTYHTDFTAEREARQKLVGEKERYLTELKILQKRNEKLVKMGDEQQSPPSTSKPETPSNFKKSPTPTKNNGGGTEFEFTADVAEFICPICARTYDTYLKLQHHVDNCFN